MDKSLFQYILRFSKREQVVVSLITFASFPFYYLSLDLPKIIINEAIDGRSEDFPAAVAFDLGPVGIALGAWEQIPYLMLLCSVFLTLILINGAFKYVINVYRGIMGERMLRRLRYVLLRLMLRFPRPRFRKVSQGELVAMVNQETEPLGGFIGESISLPLYQGGIMITILGFMFVQDPILGAAAIALYPFQAWLIPKLQAQVNALNKQRVREARRLAERIGDVVSGIHEVHANDASAYVRADFSDRLGLIYRIRERVYIKKFFIKFLNNFIAQITPFFFFSIGGYLVIQGELSFGALVAVLAAYKDLSAPWKELLNWYQRQADARIKYDQLAEQFEPTGMLDETLQDADPPENASLKGPVSASNLAWADDDGVKAIEGLNFSLDQGDRAMVVSVDSVAKDALGNLLARLLAPTGGRIMVGRHDLGALPESVTGRRIGYLESGAYLFGGSILDNLLVGLRYRPLHPPVGAPEETERRERLERASKLSGNSTDPIDAQWVDYAAAGVGDIDGLKARLSVLFKTVDLEADLFRIGLQRTLEGVERKGLREQLLEARARFLERMGDPDLQTLVEPLDPAAYNVNAPALENLLFGTPRDEAFSYEAIGENDYVRELMADSGLDRDFEEGGLKAARIMLDLFQDVPPGHEFFERFSLVDADSLDALGRISSKEEKGGWNSLAESEKARIRALPFKLTVARHRLGIVDSGIQDKILRTRARIREELPDKYRESVDFFDPSAYNDRSTVEANIMFGRLSFGRAGAVTRVRAVIAEILEELGLRQTVLDLGMAADVGVGGSRLPLAQRQKIALARALLKRPDILVINEALSALDPDTQDIVRDRVDTEIGDATLFWIDSKPVADRIFDKAMYLEGGKIGRVDDLAAARATPRRTREKKEERKVRKAAELGADERIEMLRRIPMFANLDRHHMTLLANTCETVDFRKGDRLFFQGDPGDSMYVVVDGEAAVIIETLGREDTIRTIRTHEVVGEIALLTDEPRSATIEAKTDLATLKLSREQFVELVHEQGDIAYLLLQELARRIRETSRSYSELMIRAGS